VLQYLPVYTGSYIVDAATGELVDVDTLYIDLLYAGSEAGMGGKTADSAASTPGTGLTEVEQATVDALQGVYTSEQLDAAMRGMTELGLTDDYTLQTVSYTMNKNTGDVYGQLLYTAKITDEAVIKARFPVAYEQMKASGEIRPVYYYKNVTADALTGKLVSLYSYTSVGDGAVKLKAAELTGKAAAFLKKYFPDTYAATAVNDYDSSADDGRLVYSRMVGGVIFPADSARIDVNTYDGTIDGFSLSWTDDVSFQSADGIVGADAALAAYVACFDTLLQYVAVPSQADEYSIDYALKLAYGLDSEKSVMGVDAKTGDPIVADDAGESVPLQYDDLTGVYGKTQIEALAAYGIGFSGSSFLPTAQLTQKDALVLFLSAVGYTTEDEDALYRMAYNYKLLTSAEKDPGELMTRSRLVRMLIGATEYAPAASLKGIYVCALRTMRAFRRRITVMWPSPKGLGIVRGDTNKQLQPRPRHHPSGHGDHPVQLYVQIIDKDAYAPLSTNRALALRGSRSKASGNEFRKPCLYYSSIKI
jgi:hypothetical protein